MPDEFHNVFPRESSPVPSKPLASSMCVFTGRDQSERSANVACQVRETRGDDGVIDRRPTDERFEICQNLYRCRI